MWAMAKKSENAVSSALGVLVLAVFAVATEAGALAAEAEPHTHVAIAIDPALDWEAVIAATLSAHPRGAELAARAAEAEAWGVRGRHWLAAAPALYFSYLSDSPLDDSGQLE